MSDTTELDLKKITHNYDLILKLTDQLGERSQLMRDFLEQLGNRLALAPASSKTAYHNAFPGGLVQHIFNITQKALKLNESMKMNLPKDSIIVACILHDLGKVGDFDNDLYLDQDSDWHRERGNVYKINDNIKRMTVPHRSLYMAQAAGIKLTQDEWIAVAISDGQYVDENKFYAMNEPDLALIVHMADIFACRDESRISK